MNIIEQRKQARGQAGFTLIELLVVIAILAVLAGAAIVGIGAMRSNAQETACKSDKDTIETAAEAYAVDHIDDPAFSAATLTVGDLVTAKYAKKISSADFSITYDPTDQEFNATALDGPKYDSTTATACNN